MSQCTECCEQYVAAYSNEAGRQASVLLEGSVPKPTITEPSAETPVAELRLQPVMLTPEAASKLLIDCTPVLCIQRNASPPPPAAVLLPRRPPPSRRGDAIGIAVGPTRQEAEAGHRAADPPERFLDGAADLRHHPGVATRI
jgi:hypothetical protein